MQKLVLLKKYSYAGKHMKPGDIFDAKDADVRLLKALKVAADYVPPPEPKQTWRDVAALSPVVEKVVIAEDPYTPVASAGSSYFEEGVVKFTTGEVSASATVNHSKRQYKRRDMKAE
jgi:hypothetical protein